MQASPAMDCQENTTLEYNYPLPLSSDGYPSPEASNQPAQNQKASLLPCSALRETRRPTANPDD